MKKSGNIIAELRREAGFTQKTLADALHITDKAVSKWERGLSLPDIALLPKLSVLLDADIELLLHKSTPEGKNKWAGLIDLRRFEHDMAQMIYDKPMVYYILSHFLLMNIREIHVLCTPEKQSWIASPALAGMGFQFIVNPRELPKQNLMIMQHPCFLFGSDLTRRFEAAMTTNKITKLCPEWEITPFLFCPAEYTFMYYKNPAYLNETAMLKTLGRGMICIPMDTPSQINDISSFVRMYQHNTGLSIQNPEEISRHSSDK